LKITTRTGDTGTTSLVDEEKRVKKTSIRKVVNGTLDELNSFLGMARASNPPGTIAQMLYRVQEDLFLIGTEVATTADDISQLEYRIGYKHIRRLESIMSRIEKQMEMPENFIIPGGTYSGASLDVARSVCRRLERAAVEAFDQGKIQNRFIMKYLNRLSDVLFTLARYAEFLETGKDHWPAPRKW
jgi:cob(I)alamin adenosyltransferase